MERWNEKWDALDSDLELEEKEVAKPLRKKRQEKIKVCMNCGSDEAKKRCFGCKRVFYCSQQCQRKAWLEHRNFCGPQIDERLRWLEFYWPKNELINEEGADTAAPGALPSCHDLVKQGEFVTEFYDWYQAVITDDSLRQKVMPFRGRRLICFVDRQDAIAHQHLADVHLYDHHDIQETCSSSASSTLFQFKLFRFAKNNHNLARKYTERRSKCFQYILNRIFATNPETNFILCFTNLAASPSTSRLPDLCLKFPFDLSSFAEKGGFVGR